MIEHDAAQREREVRLLLACGRVTLNAASQESLAAILAEPLDWNSIIHRASRHGLLPLLHKHLSTMRPSAVPPEILTQLSKQAVDIGRNNLRLTAELLRIIDTLGAAGLIAVPLKGPVLAQTVYGSIALRSFSDLDFLVSPQEIYCVKDTLVSLGYDPEALYWGEHHKALAQSYYHYSFVSQKHGTLVEIHYRLHLPFLQSPKHVEEMLTRIGTISFMGRNVATLTPEDQFLFLCAHGVRHLWERLEWVCGIAEIVRGGTIQDWPALLAHARADGLDRNLLSSLLLAEILIGVSVPTALAECARRDRAANTLAAQAARRLLQGLDTIPDAGERFLYTLQAFNKPRDRWKYLLFHFTSPKLADMTAVPPPLQRFRLLFRLLRIISTYGASVLRALHHDKS